MAGVVEAVLDRMTGDQSLIHAAITLDNVRAADQMSRLAAYEIIKTGH
jgi:1-deoxy-D-xylulose-5-phosphate reductoisomerase